MIDIIISASYEILNILLNLIQLHQKAKHVDNLLLSVQLIKEHVCRRLERLPLSIGETILELQLMGCNCYLLHNTLYLFRTHVKILDLLILGDHSIQSGHIINKQVHSFDINVFFQQLLLVHLGDLIINNLHLIHLIHHRPLDWSKYGSQIGYKLPLGPILSHFGLRVSHHQWI